VLRDSWRTASFSSMIAAGARAEQNQPPPIEERPDHDGRIADTPSDRFCLPAKTIRSTPTISSRSRVDRRRANACIGCTNSRISRTPPRGPKPSKSALHEHPIPVSASDALAANLPAMMARLLADTVATDLVPGMRLDAISTKRRMNELEFLFPAESLDFSSLRRVLTSRMASRTSRSEAGTLRGFVKGFIDLIVEHEGRFWIVDWKSNHLGDDTRRLRPRKRSTPPWPRMRITCRRSFIRSRCIVICACGCATTRSSGISAVICICSCAACDPVGAMVRGQRGCMWASHRWN
jgi:exodeoxyribonuclease V beta subunit